jgi:hypothetical protein
MACRRSGVRIPLAPLQVRTDFRSENRALFVRFVRSVQPHIQLLAGRFALAVGALTDRGSREGHPRGNPLGSAWCRYPPPSRDTLHRRSARVRRSRRVAAERVSAGQRVSRQRDTIAARRYTIAGSIAARPSTARPATHSPSASQRGPGTLRADACVSSRYPLPRRSAAPVRVTAGYASRRSLGCYYGCLTVAREGIPSLSSAGRNQEAACECRHRGGHLLDFNS